MQQALQNCPISGLRAYPVVSRYGVEQDGRCNANRDFKLGNSIQVAAIIQTGDEVIAEAGACGDIVQVR